MKMKTVQQIESDRQNVQTRLDSLKSASERNKMGQYATPFSLASEIVEFVRDTYFTETDKIRFLDPAVGTGAFFSAMLHAFPKTQIENAVGVEFDSQIVSITKNLWTAWGLDVVEADFAQLPFPTSPMFNIHLVNPPYVRHHHLDPKTKQNLQEKLKAAVGLDLNGLAGLYCYFLLIAHRWLAQDGFGVWLIPSEFMDVKYGEVVKRYLIEQVSLRHIHRFDAEALQFDDALVSSTVLVFQKRKPKQDSEVTFSLGGTLKAPRICAHIRQRQLAHVGKWTSLPNKSVQYVERDVHQLNETTTIGDLFEIRRGLATGANQFFILCRDIASDKGLPEQFLRPILPSPRYLNNEKIYADSEGFPLVQPSLVLLDCDLDESEIEAYPPLKAYLDWGKSQGFADRYITRHRQPWFKQENRPAAPILCNYMSRTKSGDSGLRFFRNYSQATSPNVYLMLYPNQEVQQASKNNVDLLAQLFDLLKQAKDEYLLYEGRTYGGGLNKIEPKELARVPLPDDPLLQSITVTSKQLFLLEKKSP